MTKPIYVFFISFLLLLGFMQIIVGFPVPLVYVFMVMTCVWVYASKENGMSINWACVAFLVAIVISIVGNTIPAFFKPWERFALFCMLMFGCSPMVTGPDIDRTKRHIYMGALYAMLGIAVLSFLGYFLGFGRRLTGIVNSYMGVAPHPNFLGFYTMVSMVAAASMFFRCTKQQERVIVVGLWTCCLITLLLASSRSALAMGMVGTIIAVYLRFQKNATAMINTILVFVCAIILALPYLMPFMESMFKKNMDFDNAESMVADTRGYIWQLRYWEIEKSPIIGVGAYGCDTTLPNADVFYVEKTGTIELGSSYLGLLAQCGWLGMIAFLLIAVPIIWNTYKYATRERTPYAQFWLPIIFVIAMNMIFEGYLMTAGAVQCIIVWVTLGAAEQCTRIADYPVFWEEKKNPPITPEQYVAWREAQGIENR